MHQDAWAYEFSNDGRGLSAITVDRSGRRSMTEATRLWACGVPVSGKNRYRYRYCGDPSTWERTTADKFLRESGFVLPEGLINQHAVFLTTTANRILVIPALVLMRAMFQPAGRLLELALKPQGMETISYVDHTQAPPKVVIDNLSYAQFVRGTYSGWRKERPVEWLQLSRSAKSAVRSTQLHARSGAIDIDPPTGLARFIFHGVRRGETMFVSRASLTSISVSSADSLTGSSETFNFHPTAESNSPPRVTTLEKVVPLNDRGELELTDAEWIHVEKMLRSPFKRGPVLHSQRQQLNGILLKVCRGIPWKELPLEEAVVKTCAQTFRNWSLSGRLQPVFEFLITNRTQQRLPLAA